MKGRYIGTPGCYNFLKNKGSDSLNIIPIFVKMFTFLLKGGE